jgi:hypothetical protein
MNVAPGDARPAPLGWVLALTAAAMVAAAAMAFLGAVAGLFAPGRRKVPDLPAPALSRTAQREEELGVS